MSDESTTPASGPPSGPPSQSPDMAATTQMPPVVDGPPIPRGSTVVIGVSKGVSPTAMGYVTVPDVTGMSESKGLTTLQSVGLSVGVVQSPSATPSGTVWAQLPAGGLGAPEGSRAVMIVSTGRPDSSAPMTVLPDVVGKSASEAESTLQSLGLHPYVMEEYNQAVPAGRVYAQAPDARSLAVVPHKSKAWLWVLLAILAIAAIVGIFFLVSSQGGTVAVPDVVGQQQSAAQQAITDAGLQVGTITTVPSATLPEGEVTSQTPAAGTQADKGSRVNLVVTAASEAIKVPNVVGLSADQATDQLSKAGLKSTEIQVYSSSIEKGLVVSQSPQSGSLVQSGTQVALQVSKGPQPAPNVTVPNVVGLSQSDAESALRKANLEPAVLENYSQSVPSGSVVSQAPAAGASVAPGTQVTILISKGPAPTGTETVQVPNVTQQQQAQAEATLRDVGLEPSVILQSSSQYPQGTVFSQVPLAGETVAVGTNVAIVVSTGPPQ